MTDNFSASTIFSITFFAWMYATGRSEGIKHIVDSIFKLKKKILESYSPTFKTN